MTFICSGLRNGSGPYYTTPETNLTLQEIQESLNQDDVEDEEL